MEESRGVDTYIKCDNQIGKWSCLSCDIKEPWNLTSLCKGNKPIKINWYNVLFTKSPRMVKFIMCWEKLGAVEKIISPLRGNDRINYV